MFSKRPKGATVNNNDKNNGMASLLWMLFGAIVTIAVGVVAYKSPMFGFNNNDSALEADNDEPRVKPKVAMDKDNEDYKFYDILPEQEMTAIPETPVTPNASEKSIERKTKNFRPDVVVTGKSTTEDTEKPSVNNEKGDLSTAQNAAKNAIDTTEKTTNQSTVAQSSTGDSTQVSTSSNNPDQNTSAPSKTTAKSNHNLNGSSNKSSADANNDSEIVIVYENTTYDGSTPKSESTNTSAQKTSNKDTAVKNEDSKATTADSIQANTHHTESESKKSHKITTDAVNSSKSSSEQVLPKTLVINEKKSVNTSTNNDTVAKPITVSNKPSKSYILQINSFDSSDEADRRRAQVLMAGVDAHVVKNNATGKAVYQVLSNSMATPEAVIRAQQNLQKSGIDSIIVEQRRK